ncbi:MAG TPA: CvpA family protein [Puia sp.]|jgi:membrane protein required for colicin V production|nr:CvpA family protein [Puia sp.]
MSIDVLFLLFLLLAVLRGLRQGFIIAVVSAVALVIGLAAAIKLSALVAGYGREHTHISSRWLPVLAFLLVFVVVVIGVRAGGRLAEKAVDLALLGWLNKLAGVLLFAVLYTIILSVLLFYAVQVHLVSADTLSSSVTYSFIRPWGPVVINEFGKFVPWFKGMFAQLEDFFGHLGNKL